MPQSSAALQVYATRRFLKSYERGTAIQFLVEGALDDFRRLFASDPRSIARHYQRLAGAKSSVLEFEISGGCRMIALWKPPRLSLLDVGDHDLIRQFNTRDIEGLAESAMPAALSLVGPRGAFFLPDRPGPIGRYANEISPEWLYFLDDEQDRLATILCDAAESRLLEGAGYAAHLVLGGPGTGKTCILLNLLKRLHNREKFSTKVALPRQVKDYIEGSLRISLSDVWIPSDAVATYEPSEQLDVLLMDDPRDLSDVRHATELAKRGAVRFVVAAFDPLQLNRTVADLDFDAFVVDTGASVHELRLCYRQKENVGQQSQLASNAIADSTPYLDPIRKRDFITAHARLTALANDLRFSNPHGYVKTWNPAGPAEFTREINRISEHNAQVWSHAASLLVVLHNPTLEQLPEECQLALERFPGTSKVIGSGALSSVKGVEFQHVFLLLDEPNFAALVSGFHGSGTRVYDQRRLFRIPFSRAKDSLVTFVWTASRSRASTPGASRAHR